MGGGDLPASSADTIALLANPALREVTAGSSDNREIIRERLFAEWNVEESFIGELIVWTADAADWADGTTSAHARGHYGAIFWTGSEPYELKGNIQLQSFVGIDQRNADWTLTDLWVDAPQSPDGVHPDIRIEGEGEDRVIRGTIPAHGCLWFALD